MTAAEPRLQLSESNISDALNFVDIKPRRIALLGYRSHPFVGGQGIYLKYLSRALVALGHTVDVISGPPYPELDSSINLIKVPSLNLFAQPSHVTALRPKHLLSLTDTIEWWSMLTGGFAEPYTFGRRIQKLLQNSNYDIVHDNQSLCFALLKLQQQGMNIVSTIHHPIHRDKAIALQAAEKWGDRLLIKRWYSFLRMQEKVVAGLNNVITVSHTSQRDIEKYFSRSADKTRVIVNGVDTETFRPPNCRNASPLRVLTTASSDQPLKGLQYLLQAVGELKTQYPKIHLRIVGKLKKGGDTEKRLHQLALADCVSFVSDISTEELVAEYAEAAVVVCPSLYEGFGLPAAEAMACAAPVISTDGGALPEVVGNAGITVPAANSAALATEIKNIVDHPEYAKKIGQQGRMRMIEKFSWHNVAIELSHYYESIINRADH